MRSRASTGTASAADLGPIARRGAARRAARGLRRVGLGLAALLLTVGLTACGGGNGAADGASDGAPAAPAAAEGTSPSPEPARAVRVVPIGTGDLTAQRRTSASVAAAKASRVASGASGRVERVLVRAGSRVDAGQVVLELDDDQLRSQLRNAELAVDSAGVNLESSRRRTESSLEQLRAQMRSAEANLRVAEDRYAEAQRLFDAGGVARVDVLGAEAQLEQARSAVLQARDALTRAERASTEDLRLLELQLDQARTQADQARNALSEARIAAPFAGEVATLFVEEGEFVGAGSPVFQLVTLDELVATVRVSPEDAQVLQQRDTLWLRYGGLDYASRVARVERTPEQPRQVTLVLDLVPAENPIPIGSVAELRYDVALGNGLRVPSGALSAESGQTFVFVVDSDGERAVRTPVQVVAESGASAIVEGLEPGDLVVSPRPLDVRDDTRVRISERGPATGALPGDAAP